MKQEPREEAKARIPSRQFARELSYEEIKLVSGGAGSTGTVNYHQHPPTPDVTYDLNW